MIPFIQLKKNSLLFATSLTLPLLLLSCGLLPQKKQEKPKSPFGATGIPKELRSSSQTTAAGGTPIAAGGNAQTHPSTLNLTPEEDIVFTDPDNPEANLPELSKILSENTKKNPAWEQSETIARQRAAREGKPILIWFTDSQNSPMCKALDDELFAKADFEQWATEKLIRLRVDSNYKNSAFVKDPNISIEESGTREVDSKRYTSELAKRYKVLGSPCLILLNPSGEVIGRYRGYKRGDANYTWGLIKQGEAATSSAREQWRASLEKKGYREWANRKDQKVLAKLTNYHNGTLILIQPDGTRCKTTEDKLSDKDRTWINEQKKLRGL